MISFDFKGDYVPSSLFEQLLAAGVAVLGVTADEPAGTVSVHCGDGVIAGDVSAVVGSYIAPGEPEPVVPLAVQIADEMRQTIHGAVSAVPDDGTVADLKAAILSALAQS